MKKLLLAIVFVSIVLSNYAFEIKGKISGTRNFDVESYNNHMVYLWKNKVGDIHMEWTAQEIVDSCVIKDLKFKLKAPNTKYATTYRVSLKNKYLYYFLNKDQDLNLDIEESSKYKCYDVATGLEKAAEEMDEKIIEANYRGYTKAFNNTLSKYFNKNINSIYQDMIKKVNTEYFNPWLKREAIEYLKDHINSEAALYFIALYSSNVPDRFHAKTFFSNKQMQEILKLLPKKFITHPLYSVIVNNAIKIAESYKKPDGYHIKGYLHNMSSNYVVLVLPKKGTASALVPVDTAEVVNGYFEFKGKVDHPQYAIVGILGGTFHKHFFIDNTDIEVTLYSGKTGCSYKNGWLDEKVWGVNFYSHIKGCKAYDDWQAFEKVTKNGYREIGNWIKEHPKSYPTLVFLSTMVKKCSPKKMKQWIALFDKSLKCSAEYKSIEDKIKIVEKTSKGAGAPDFTLKDMKGKSVSLKQFRGKYVLIDFWASWCGPCKAEMPNIKEAYEKYKDKGLVVISISSDRSREKWIKAVKHEGMTWIQLTSNGSSVMNDYGVSGIPALFLIDKKGEIIASGLRGKNIIGECKAAITGE